MKVLLSAFACAPNAGSENGVGWNWALRLAEAGHHVTVLTRAKSREAIEREVARLAVRDRLRFAYHEVPPRLQWETRGGLHLHHLLWQWGAARVAARLHAGAAFDRVHHVTYAGLRAPSFMGRLGIPFVFGPVGGGESAPWRLRLGCGWRGLVLDSVRDLANFAIRLEPLIGRTFAQAEKVYVTSGETLRLIPRCYRDKAEIELAIGSDERAAPPPPRPAGASDGIFRVLYVGRFIYVKGMHLGLPAFARLLAAHPRARLTMVGEGPEMRPWQRLALRMGISGNVDWLSWQRHEETAAIYRRHDVLLFPSLHDPGGMVVLEAMSEGLPVVCLGLGGPGIMVNERCGRAIPATGRSQAEIVRALGDALIELADPAARARLAPFARERAREFSWQKKVMRIYGEAS